MPQMAPAVLKDGAATPVNRTFKPRDSSAGVTTFVESNGIPLGDRRLTISLTRANTGKTKVSLRLVLPELQDSQIAGQKTVGRTAYANIDFTFDASSTTDDRKNAAALLASALNDAMLKGVIVDLEGIY